MRRHTVHSLIGLAWGGVVFWYAIDFLWWVAPIVLGMAVAITVVAVAISAAIVRQRLDRLDLVAVLKTRE